MIPLRSAGQAQLPPVGLEGVRQEKSAALFVEAGNAF
jgi:hypothetical protein